MSIKSRLKTLESHQPTAHDPVIISWFGVLPKDAEPVGYTFKGQEFLRLPGETIGELQDRCVASVKLSAVFGENVFTAIPKSGAV